MMLNQDWTTFHRRFPGASSFLLAGSLRMEVYRLARDLRYPALFAAKGKGRSAERLKELLALECCREPWFVTILREVPEAGPFLFAAGL